MAAPRVLGFDFDGVLADTEPLIHEAWARIFAYHGIVLSWEDYCRFGRSATDSEMLERLRRFRAGARC